MEQIDNLKLLKVGDYIRVTAHDNYYLQRFKDTTFCVTTNDNGLLLLKNLKDNSSLSIGFHNQKARKKSKDKWRWVSSEFIMFKLNSNEKDKIISEQIFKELAREL